MNSLMSMRMNADSSSKRNCGQGLAQLGFADAGRAEEEERADGAVGVAEPGPRAADRVRHRPQGLVLADDARVQPLFHS